MIEKLYLYVVGYGVFFGLMYGIWKANARRWTRLARKYGCIDGSLSEESQCFAKRTMQTVILVGGDVGWNSYKGIVTVGVTPEGILLQLMPPFSTFHRPLLIPFRDSRVEPKQWYLFGKSFQYSVAQVSDVQIIVHDELQHWIESQAASLAVAVN